jgi:hypothetical protein
MAYVVLQRVVRISSANHEAQTLALTRSFFQPSRNRKGLGKTCRASALVRYAHDI